MCINRVGNNSKWWSTNGRGWQHFLLSFLVWLYNLGTKCTSMTNQVKMEPSLNTGIGQRKRGTDYEDLIKGVLSHGEGN